MAAAFEAAHVAAPDQEGPGGEHVAGRLAEGLRVTNVQAELVGGECPYRGSSMIYGSLPGLGLVDVVWDVSRKRSVRCGRSSRRWHRT